MNVVLNICARCQIVEIFFLLFHSNPVAGESSLDRFACGVGGKTVLPHVIATIPPMLQHGKMLNFWFKFCFEIGLYVIILLPNIHWQCV